LGPQLSADPEGHCPRLRAACGELDRGHEAMSIDDAICHTPTAMARSDLLLNLVHAGAVGDQVGFRRTVEAMIAEEREHQHHVVADRLAEYLKGSGARGPSGDAPLGSYDERHSERVLADLVLPDSVAGACAELVEEQQRADLLRSHSIEPRHRILLAGPPGNGKTSLAEALAGELALPLLVVRYDGVIGSYLGETAVRLARLMEHVRTRRCVVFFDEFDAIGKERGDEHETGEIKRVVSSLLINIDALPSYVVVVTATNHPELLDRAVWRRFQIRLELPLPDRDAVAEWLRRFEERTDTKLGLSPKQIDEHLMRLSFAELEDFCTDVLRRMVLQGPKKDAKSIVTARLRQLSARFQVRS
jgi:predicted AAA+ superfamily ATPase